MYKLLDVVVLKTGEKCTIVEEYADGSFMVEIPPKNGEEPELRDIEPTDIKPSLKHRS